MNEESRDSVSRDSVSSVSRPSPHEVIHVHDDNVSPARSPAARLKTTQKQPGPSDKSKTVSKQNRTPCITVRHTYSVSPHNTTHGESRSGVENRSDPSESLEHTRNNDQADNRTVASDIEQNENESTHL